VRARRADSDRHDVCLRADDLAAAAGLAVIARSEATKQSRSRTADWIASLRSQ